MNKGITIFILVVLLCAMGIIFYSHMGDNAPEPASPKHTDATRPDAYRAPVNGNATESSSSRPSLLGQPAATTPTVPDAGRNASTPTRALPPLDRTERTDRGERATTPEGQTAQSATRPDPEPAAASNGRNVASTEPVDSGATPAAQSAGASVKTPGAQNATATPASGKQPQATQADTGKTQAGTSTANATTQQPAASSTQTASATATHTLKSIGVHFSGQNMLLRIESDSAFPIKHFVLSNPDRLVIDLPGTWKNMKAPTVPQNNIIKAVRLGSQAAGPRLVLDLAKAPVHQEVVKVSDTVVEIRVR